MLVRVGKTRLEKSDTSKINSKLVLTIADHLFLPINLSLNIAIHFSNLLACDLQPVPLW